MSLCHYCLQYWMSQNNKTCSWEVNLRMSGVQCLNCSYSGWSTRVNFILKSDIEVGIFRENYIPYLPLRTRNILNMLINLYFDWSSRNCLWKDLSSWGSSLWYVNLSNNFPSCLWRRHYIPSIKYSQDCVKPNKIIKNLLK